MVDCLRQDGRRMRSEAEKTDDAYYRKFKDGIPADADRNITLYPGVYGEVVSLLTAAYRITGDQRFLKRATALADESLVLFWDNGPLPRCSSRGDHYEAITRADTLALSLLELRSVRKSPYKPLVFSWIDR